jgi:sugar phosphate isomerase/epimerase
MKGPAIFLAQFLPPLGETITLQDMCKWAASLGYEGVQVPTWDKRIFDLELASESQDYCEEVMWICREAGVQISELSTHLQGQVVAAHPAYLEALNPLCPEHLADDMGAQREWGKQQLVCAAKASQRLGLTAHATF